MKSGYQNELEFINYLNNKKYEEINILMHELLITLFPDIKGHDTITCYKYGSYAKVDIVIAVRGIKKGISIKSGICNSVHLEPIDKFMSYLCMFNFTETDKFLRYLYSDGTNNNTGKTRQSNSEYKLNHQDDIISINKNLNTIKDYLINRFLIETDIHYKIKVDAFIEGNVNDFLWATSEEVLNHLRNCNSNTSGVHVSNLYIQNWNKNLKYNPKYERCRNYIQVKWYSIFDDLIKIMCNRGL